MDTPECTRRCLIREWSSLRNFYREQPLDYIRDYMGIKVALYFAWLGFYTYMLLIATAAGLVAIIYSLVTMTTDSLVNEICQSPHILCPRCDKYCDYTELKSSCNRFKFVDVFDNVSMVVYAFFMSLWCKYAGVYGSLNIT